MQFTLTMTKEERRWLTWLSAQQDRPAANWIRRAIREAYEQQHDGAVGT